MRRHRRDQLARKALQRRHVARRRIPPQRIQRLLMPRRLRGDVRRVKGLAV